MECRNMKKSEQNILKYLRETKEPVCAVQIIHALPEMKEITIRKGIQALLQNGIICVDGMVQNGKNYARTFKVNSKRERQYYDELVSSTNKDAFGFACELLERNALTNEELVAIRKLIDERL